MSEQAVCKAFVLFAFLTLQNLGGCRPTVLNFLVEKVPQVTATLRESNFAFSDVYTGGNLSDISKLRLVCTSSYPIYMLYDYEVDRNYFPGVDQYIHRRTSDFQNRSTYSFTAYMRTTVKNFLNVGKIACASWDGKDASYAYIWFRKDNLSLLYIEYGVVKMSTNASSKSPAASPDDCRGIQLITRESEVGSEWNCIDSNLTNLSPSPMFIYCYSYPDCQNLFRSYQLMVDHNNCVIRVEDCPGCVSSHFDVGHDKQYHPQVVLCVSGETTLVGTTFFFTFPPQGEPSGHKLRLAWDEFYLAEEALFVINPTNNPSHTYRVNDMLDIECHGVQFYFSFGYRIGIQYNDGPLQILPEGGPYKRQATTNSRIIQERVPLIEAGRVGIYCFAPVITSFDWVTKDVWIDVIEEQITMDKGPAGPSLTPDNFTPMTLGLMVAGAMIVLAAIGVALISFLRMRRMRGILTQISQAEVTEFLEGRVSSLDDDSSPQWDCLPYNIQFDVGRNVLKFDENDLLGSGAYGKVFRGVLTLEETQESVQVAVKTVNPGVDVCYYKALLSELKILAYLGNGHPNVVHLVAAYTKGIQRGEVLIAIELCPSGSLLSVVREINKDTKDARYVNLGKGARCQGYENLPPSSRSLENQLLRYSYEIADGMSFLAERRVVHGDLSLRNVLLAEDGTTRISDFGLARQLVDYNYLKSEQCPLPWKWMAIETLKEMRFSSASDVWSYGITLWELFSLGSVPYPGLSWTQDFLRMLDEGLRPDKPVLASEILYALMMQCWDPEPATRYKFEALKSFLGDILNN